MPSRHHTKRRTPSGRATRATGAGGDREFAPTQVKRLRDAAVLHMAAPEWGTELGRLYLNRAITSEMYAAGKRWAEWVSTYLGAIGAFPVRSPAAEPGRGAAAPDPDSDRGMAIARREADHAERFFAAHAVLVAAGPAATSMVRQVCEQDQTTCGIAEVFSLRSGLGALVTHWGLDRPAKSDDNRGR